MKQRLLFLLLVMMATVSYADTNYNEIDIGPFTYNLILRTNGESTAVLIDLSEDGQNIERLDIPGYINYQGNKYRVNKIGYMAFSSYTNIKRVFIEYGVTEIDEEAFDGCSNLTTVTLPSSIKKIGDKAFYYCSSLKTLAFAGDVPPTIYNHTFTQTGNSKKCYTATYRGANALKEVFLWSAAFPTIERDDDNYYAYDFKKQGIAYVIKNGIPYNHTVSKCIMVGGNSTNNGIVTLSQYVEAATIESPPGNYFFEAVADSAFLNNTSVTRVSNYTSMADRIGEAAFANCTNLTQAYIAVDSIMINAFKNCTNLTTLKMYKHNQDGPNGVVYIGSYAFENCGITTVNIPGSCKTIGNAPFINCSNLTTITVDSDNEYYASHNGCLYNYNYVRLYQVPGAWDCSSYGNYNTGFHSNLKYINDYAFEGNRTIVYLTLPYGVEKINYRAFGYCPNLQGVRLPSSITSLSPYFLRGSTNVKYLYVNLTTPPSLSTYIFASSIANNIKLYVPCESYSAYKSATYWKTFDIQTGPLDHTEVWDYWDYYNRRWTVLDNTVHDNYAGNIRAGNVRLVRGTTSTIIPASVIIGTKYYDPIEIGRSAFEGLASTVTISVSSGEPIERIKERAFYGTTLNDFSFTRVKEIGDSAFMSTTELSKSLNLNNIEKVGIRAFYNSAITSFKTGANLNYMGTAAFGQAKSLATVEINAKAPLTVIPENAFYNCTALATIKFPAALKTLKKYALYYTKLTDIELPYGFTTAEEEALTCNAARIVFPATISSIHYKFNQRAHNYLYELVVNSKTPPTIAGSNSSSFDVSSLPRNAGYLYVPVERVATYRSKWGQFGGDHHISEGGYDFTYASEGLKFNVLTTPNGNTAGTCEMVYNPKVLNTVTSVIAGDIKSDTYGRNYNCTSIGDKCFATSTSIITIYITSTLKRIGDYAFLNSSLRNSLESMSGGGSSGYIPKNVNYIGTMAFNGCKNLHELFLPHIDRQNAIAVGQWFFGDNTNDFKLWVDYRCLPDYINNNVSWDVSRVYPHLKLDSEWQSFSCIKDINFSNTLVEAYVVKSYDKTSNEAELKNVLAIPEGTGAVVHGQADGTYYRLSYPSSTPSASSMMEGVTTSYTTVTSNNALTYYRLNPNNPFFNKISSSTFYRGYAYLKLNTSVCGGATTVDTNLGSSGGGGLFGDVNCDGSVNAADVTALYNYILNGDTTFLATSDVNNDGAVNAADVTAVYNIILGQN